MGKTLGLKYVLIATFVGIVAVPLLIAGYFGILEYKSGLHDEAGANLEGSLSIAHKLLEDLGEERVGDLDTLGEDPEIQPGSASDRDLIGELFSRSNKIGADSLFIADQDGDLIISSTGAVDASLDWGELSQMIATGNRFHRLTIVPGTALTGMGLGSDFEVESLPTDGATVLPSEAEGAIAIVAVSPLRSGRTVSGYLVSIDSLKASNSFVDEVVDHVGGVATVFQYGLRVATTSEDESGSRIVGTSASDQVREKTLHSGEAFRDEESLAGRMYLSAYDPILDVHGKPIGMLHVGVELERYNKAVRTFAVSFTVVLTVSLALAILGAFLVVRTMTRPLAGITEAVTHLAGGDLTRAVPETGFAESVEVSRNFNHMTKELRTVIARVRDSAQTLHGVARDISSASSDSADQAARQASAVAESTATIEQLSRTFSAVADGAQRVLDTAEFTLESADTGRESIDESTETMDSLAAGSEEVRDAARAAAAVTEDIGEMTYIISMIAEQTKILALNAAIEAARAGDAGQGFGVVASEIRILADNVSKSAAHIKSLVGDIQSASSRLLKTADGQASLTQRGVDQSRSTREAFDSIVAQMAQTASAAREIATAASEQRAAAEQLVHAMHDVSAAGSESASAARQLADASKSVEHEAEELQRGMEDFKTDTD